MPRVLYGLAATLTISCLALMLPSPAAAGPLVLYGVNSSDDGLSVYDAATGSATFIGPLGPDGLYVTPVGMAVRPSDYKIFAWNNGGGVNDAGSGLLTVDPATGAATSFIAIDFGFGGIAFAADGTLYGVTGNSLYTIDTGTGALALVHTTDGFIGDAQAADFSPGGILYAADNDTATSSRLLVYDASGVVSVVAPLSIYLGTVGALVFDPSGILIGAASGTTTSGGPVLFDIDPTNGVVSNIRNTTIDAQGLGFAPAAVPEPGSLTLLAIGLVSFGGIAWRKRRLAV